MLTIGKVAELTGFSPDTLRYYEKIGLISPPERINGGIRLYSEKEVGVIHFLNSLKLTGMSLEDMSEFLKDGCILHKNEEEHDLRPSIQNRLQILSKHLEKMERQRQELDTIIELTKEMMVYYQTLLLERMSKQV